MTGTLRLIQGELRLVCDRPRGVELFVSREAIRGVRAGQAVTARLERGRGGKLRAHILGKGRRVAGQWVGVLNRKGRGAVVSPEEGGEPLFIDSPSSDIAEGTAVVARVVQPGHGDEWSRGEVVEVLGDPEQPLVQLEMLLRAQPLRREFPAAVLAEAAALPAPDPARDIVGRRRDLRDLPHVTIDGADARDFDDAVVAERIGDGIRVWVSIADVAHYVAEGSALDGEARARGTSVYLPQRVLPMLPERLSNDLCSLRPDLPRLTHTCEMTVRPDGKFVDVQVYPSLIHSRARLIYEDVQRFLDGDKTAVPTGVQESLNTLLLASRALRVRRKGRGGLDLDLPEAKVVLGPDGVAADIRLRGRIEAHRLVEDLMIAANEAVAEHLLGAGRPGVYRIHEPPDPDKLRAFVGWCEKQGMAMPQKLERGVPSPSGVAKLLEGLKGHPKAEVAQTLLLRSLSQARYSTQNLGHFGLASRAYLHFTSPIRRYPDLLVHRILSSSKPPAFLEVLAEESSERERDAMVAERAMVSLHQCHVAIRHIGETFKARVIGMHERGLFLRPEGVFVEGMLAVNRLEAAKRDGFVMSLVDQAFVGRRTRQRIGLGDVLEVVISRVNPRRRQIDLDLAGPTGSASFRTPTAARPTGAREESSSRWRRRGPSRNRR